MKKLLSAMLAAMLAISCTSAAFAAEATPDQPAEATPVSVKFNKLPEKLTYQFDNEECGFDVSGFTIGDLENNPEILLTAPFFIKADLTGAEIEATLSDGTTAIVENSECTTSVADPFDLSVLKDFIAIEEPTEEDIDALDNILMSLFREYTINVDYKGVSTSYKVAVTKPAFEEPDFTSELFEFESYSEPEGNNVFVIEEDLEDYEFEDVDDNGNDIVVKGTYLAGNTDDMTVTVKNKETGELVTLTDDDIMVELDLPDVKAKDVKPGIYTAEGTVFVDDGMVTFDYPVVLVSKEAANKPDDNKKPTTPDATSGTNKATDDTANNNTNKPDDNKAVQTGTPVAAGILLSLLLAGTVFLYYAYKGRREF